VPYAAWNQNLDSLPIIEEMPLQTLKPVIAAWAEELKEQEITFDLHIDSSIN